METSRKWRFSWCLVLGLLLLATTLQNVQGEEESEAPSQCKPYIEKALKEQQKDEPVSSEPPDDDGVDEGPADDSAAHDDQDDDNASAGEDDSETGDDANAESTETEQGNEAEVSAEDEQTEEQADDASVEKEDDAGDSDEGKSHEEEEEMQGDQPAESGEQSEADVDDAKSEEGDDAAAASAESVEDGDVAESVEETADETGSEPSAETAEGDEGAAAESEEAGEADAQSASAEDGTASAETQEEGAAESAEQEADTTDEQVESAEDAKSGEASAEADDQKSDEAEDDAGDSAERGKESAEEAEASKESVEEAKSDEADVDESVEMQKDVPEVAAEKETEESTETKEDTASGEDTDKASAEEGDKASAEEGDKASAEEADDDTPSEEDTKEDDSEDGDESKEAVPEEDLILEIDIPENLRPRDHLDQLLKLDESNDEAEAVVHNIADKTLTELKKLYENAIKPLETLYKYRDLSNRHFGDSEIFSKPLVVFMGPWSGGKSSIINYLVDNEYNATSLRTGAEPSPAYFNLLMYGEEPEVLDGTQLAADFTFAGLQKFGQGLEERLRGLKLPNKLLEKINIVEIPGILEVRKQVSRVFPFNDACQWFIDRADIIFLVYDPSKLDVGPETEAILDQLKGREHQTRIVLNKADQVKPEELMRVQSALIWNISPLMSSAQPPIMYTTSLWSRPYETWAPVRLLQAQERAFLRDLRSAVDKKIENKIASARRFAVRVRNHAKMVDCYLTTYYNHKSLFGNRKQVSDQIIEHPQDYHIYEGLSTLTNISRYDLPDPDVYRDFFRLNPLYEFQQLSATCTYFRGCPINRLDVAIAYDLPELVGKHKKLVEAALTQIKGADNS